MHQFHNIAAASRLTDVTDFFLDIIDEYLLLEEQAQEIIRRIPEAHPDDLLVECTALRQRKCNLSQKDEQMISIMTLAGKELSNTPLIHDYRVAFARATLACNNLYQGLKALQLHMTEEALQKIA